MWWLNYVRRSRGDAVGPSAAPGRQRWNAGKRLHLPTQLVGFFFTLGLECSPCFEGVCLHEHWSKLSASPTRIHCCCNYSNAICHCKSSDYSAEWLLMKPSSDSFPAQRRWEDIDELRWLLRLRGKLHRGFAANPSGASQKLLPWIHHVRCHVPNCSEKLVCNHSRCLQSCWEEINLFNLNSR